MRFVLGDVGYYYDYYYSGLQQYRMTFPLIVIRFAAVPIDILVVVVDGNSQCPVPRKLMKIQEIEHLFKAKSRNLMLAKLLE